MGKPSEEDKETFAAFHEALGKVVVAFNIGEAILTLVLQKLTGVQNADVFGILAERFSFFDKVNKLNDLSCLLDPELKDDPGYKKAIALLREVNTTRNKVLHDLWLLVDSDTVYRYGQRFPPQVKPDTAAATTRTLLSLEGDIHDALTLFLRHLPR